MTCSDLTRALCRLGVAAAMVLPGTVFAAEPIDHEGEDWSFITAGGKPPEISGEHINIGRFYIGPGAEVAIFAHEQLILEAREIVIEGTLNATGRGFPAAGDSLDGLGPGQGFAGDIFTGGGGAGHGGQGGSGGSADAERFTGGAPGGTYGSAGNFDGEFGSSGGAGSDWPDAYQNVRGGSSGAGGGVIILRADEIVIEGVVAADGAAGQAPLYILDEEVQPLIEAAYSFGGGGGSGGTVIIASAKLHGAGTIRARGGDGGANDCPYSYQYETCIGGGGGAGGWLKLATPDASTPVDTDVSAGLGGIPNTGLFGLDGEPGQVALFGLPRVEFADARLRSDGVLEVDVAVLDLESAECELEFSVESPWPAHSPGLVQVVEGVTSSPTGERVRVEWDAAAALPRSDGEVELLFRARDELGFGPVERARVVLALGPDEAPDEPEGDPNIAPGAAAACACSSQPRGGWGSSLLLVVLGLCLARRRE